MRGVSGLFQFGAVGRKAEFGEAEEDQAEYWRGVLLGCEARVGAELVRGIPKALFERGVAGVIFRWSDPNHFPWSSW